MALRVHEGKPVAGAARDAGSVGAEDRDDVSILQSLDPIVPLAWIATVELQSALLDQLGGGWILSFTDQYHRLLDRHQVIRFAKGKGDKSNYVAADNWTYPLLSPGRLADWAIVPDDVSVPVGD